jgi:hypothetical protein
MFVDLGYVLCHDVEHLGIGKTCKRGQFWCVSVSPITSALPPFAYWVTSVAEVN